MFTLFDKKVNFWPNSYLDLLHSQRGLKFATQISPLLNLKIVTMFLFEMIPCHSFTLKFWQLNWLNRPSRGCHYVLNVHNLLQKSAQKNPHMIKISSNWAKSCNELWGANIRTRWSCSTFKVTKLTYLQRTCMYYVHRHIWPWDQL